MILADTSVWAAYFNGEETEETAFLDLILQQDHAPVVTLPIILTEILQGFRSDRSHDQAARLLRALPLLEPSPDTHVRAAALYRSLRKRGITVRGAVDVVIAQVCIETGARLLTLDRDFAHIARHTDLELAEPAPPEPRGEHHDEPA